MVLARGRDHLGREVDAGLRRSRPEVVSGQDIFRCEVESGEKGAQVYGVETRQRSY